MSRPFTTRQILRYPLVFGSCLAAYFTAFSFRKWYFKAEIEEKREQNLVHGQQNMAKIQAAKQLKKEVLSPSGKKELNT